MGQQTAPQTHKYLIWPSLTYGQKQPTDGQDFIEFIVESIRNHEQMSHDHLSSMVKMNDESYALTASEQAAEYLRTLRQVQRVESHVEECKWYEIKISKTVSDKKIWFLNLKSTIQEWMLDEEVLELKAINDSLRVRCTDRAIKFISSCGGVESAIHEFE